MIIDQLIESIIAKQSPIVVGLDPRLESLPPEIVKEAINQYGESLEAAANAILQFNKGIIDAVYEEVPAVKPQIAFYEQYGIEGLKAYKETCEYAKSKGLIVIADVKRGDIGSTSKAYSNAFLGSVQVGNTKLKAFHSDFLTINPYLGDDCMREFMADIKANDKGMFILVKTSNPTSGQLQDLMTGDYRIYEKTAQIVDQWNQENVGEKGYSPIGAVVGATYPEELKRLRAQMPKAFLLVPGYGAQGGGAQEVLEAFDDNGLGAIINSSRGIIFAYQKMDLPYQEAAKKAVLEMKKDILETLKANGKARSYMK